MQKSNQSANEEAISQGKKAAVAAYITLIGSFIGISMNQEHKDPFGAFHVRQGLGLNLTFWLLAVLLAPVDNTWIVTPFFLFIVILWLFGFTKAVMNEQVAVPILGGLFQKIFKKII